jgi:hypothetical protein
VVVLDDAAPRDGALDPGHRPVLPAFHVYPDAEGRAAGTAYDDAGDGDGPWRVDRLSLEAGVVSWTREGDWPAPDRVRVVVHGAAVGAATADGRRVPVTTGDRGEVVLECGPFDRLELS